MGHAFVCFRYFLVGGTILLGISGAVMSVSASYFLYQLHEYSLLSPTRVCGSAATLLALGVITCGLGWFAWQFLDFSNKSQIIIFSVALGIIVMIEAGVGIWSLIRHEQIDNMPHHKLFTYPTKNEKLIWDQMQSSLKCCGMDGPFDYHEHDRIPWSCCNKTHDSNTEGACPTLYKRGCQHAVLNRTKLILLHVFLLALCAVLLQISFVACTTCYVRIYRDQMERKRTAEAMKLMALREKKETDTKHNLFPSSTPQSS